MDVNVLVGVQFGEPLRQHAQGHERHALDVGDLILIRLAHINDLDAQLGVVQRLFHFLHGHFVGIGGRLGRSIGDAAESLVINQFGDGRDFRRIRGIADRGAGEARGISFPGR